MRKLAKFRNYINSLLIDTGFQIERSNLYLPFNFPVSKKFLKVPIQQRLTNDFLIRFSGNCDVLIDVGANRGTFTEAFNALNKNVTNYIFEPIPELYQFLKEKFNTPSVYKIYNLAISDSYGEAEFHIAANDGQSSSLYEIGERHKKAAPHALEVKKIKVPVSSLDLILEEEVFNKAFIKIDVQGAELQAIQGAIDTLKRSTAVHIEVSIQSLYEGDTIGYKIWEILVANEFTLYGMDPWFRDPKANGELLQCDFFFIKNNLLTNNL